MVTKAKPRSVSKAFDPYSGIDDVIDGIEKDYSLSGSGLARDEERMSTNNLTLDLILGGGITGGRWYTLYGGEQSCKSTGANSIMAAGVQATIPIISMWDYEGSTEPDYLGNILKTNNIKESVEDVFGIRDTKTNQWIVKPRVRYYTESVAEKFFDYLAKLLRTLPDKRKIGDDWYLVYEDTKPNRALLGSAYDDAYFKKTGKLRVIAGNSKMQALVIVDSYPAMLPEKQDVDDPGSAMAAQARMFSEQIKRVKGKLRAKRVAVIGVNQLREKPMVMFGPPEYEPGGQALRFYSDCRLRMASRALSAVVNGAKGSEEVEPSIDGGNDTYRYIHVRATKNKLSAPNLEGFIRLWVTDSAGNAQGFDPVFDTFQYLEMTGQVSGSRNKLRLMLNKKPEASKVLSWIDFKTLILGSIADIKKVCTNIGIKPLRVRQFCKDQISSYEAIDLMFEAKRKASEKKKADAGAD